MSKDQKETPAQTAGQPKQAVSGTQPDSQSSPKVDDTQAVCSYANFCRVNGTPEELIVDFGLNSQLMGPTQEPLVIKQRIVVNYYTAKRLLAALHASVQRHEAVFGVLETNIQKRALPGALRQTPASQPSD